MAQGLGLPKGKDISFEMILYYTVYSMFEQIPKHRHCTPYLV